MIFANMTSGDTTLHLPFVVCEKDLSEAQLNHLLDLFETKVGGEHFRERDLYLEVLEDHRTKRNKPFAFLYGPYVGVTIIDKGIYKGVRRITVEDKPPGGYTVYGYDQVIDLINNLDGTEKTREVL